MAGAVQIRKIPPFVLLSTLPFIVMYSCGKPAMVVPANRPPVANAGPDLTVYQGQAFRLSGLESYDPDGRIVSSQWFQTGGRPVRGLRHTSMSQELFAPFIGSGDEDLQFMVTVTDDGGLTNSDTVKINVKKYLFFDDFKTDTTRNYSLVYSAPHEDRGQFLYVETLHKVRVMSDYGAGLRFSQDVPACDNGTFSFSFSTTRSQQNQGMIRVYLLENEKTYYEVSLNGDQGYGKMRKVINGMEADSVPLKKQYAQNTDNLITIRFSPKLTILDALEHPVLMNGDRRSISVKRFEIYTEGQDIYFDDIVLSQDPFVKIVIPNRVGLWKGKLFVKAFSGNVQKDSRARFILDYQTKSQQIIDDRDEPFEATFINVSLSRHTIDVFIMDPAGTETIANNKAIYTAKDGYYVAIGDSITRGEGDNTPSGDASSKRKNTPGGFEPVLEKLLESAKGYSHTIVNAGINGITSGEGLLLIPAILARHPEANYFLVLFGTNDSYQSVPSGKKLHPGNPGYAYSFKHNMQEIISLILEAGKTPLLAKVPIVLGDTLRYPNPDRAPRNLLIKEYNQVIEELVLANGIPVSPPDFYSHFKIHPKELSDYIHPNGKGYRSMAQLWFHVLSQ